MALAPKDATLTSFLISDWKNHPVMTPLPPRWWLLTTFPMDCYAMHDFYCMSVQCLLWSLKSNIWNEFPLSDGSEVKLRSLVPKWCSGEALISCCLVLDPGNGPYPKVLDKAWVYSMFLCRYWHQIVHCDKVKRVWTDQLVVWQLVNRKKYTCLHGVRLADSCPQSLEIETTTLVVSWSQWKWDRFVDLFQRFGYIL